MPGTVYGAEHLSRVVPRIGPVAHALGTQERVEDLAVPAAPDGGASGIHEAVAHLSVARLDEAQPTVAVDALDETRVVGAGGLRSCAAGVEEQDIAGARFRRRHDLVRRPHVAPQREHAAVGPEA